MKIVITEEQLNKIYESSKEVNFSFGDIIDLSDNPKARMYMRSFGFNTEMIKDFLSKKIKLSSDDVINLFKSVGNVDYHFTDKFEQMYTIESSGESSIDFTERAMLEFALKYYSNIADAKTKEDNISMLKSMLEFFGNKVEESGEGWGYSRPEYEIKTKFNPLPKNNKLPNFLITSRRKSCTNYTFETYKGFKGYIRICADMNGDYTQAFTMDGELIGRVWVGDYKIGEIKGLYSGAMSSESTKVKDEYRKQGIMTALYDLFQIHGIYVVPSTVLKQGAKEFWKNRKVTNRNEVYPEVLKYIQRVTNYN